MRCEEAQQEIAVALLTKDELGAELCEHVAACEQCGATLAELDPVASLLAVLPDTQLVDADLVADRELLDRLLDAARARRHRRRWVMAAAAALVVLVAGVAGVVMTPGHPPVLAGAVTAGAISAAVAVEPSGGSSSVVNLTVAGLAPGTSCTVRAVTSDGRQLDVVTWSVGYRGTGHVTGDAAAGTTKLVRIELVSADTGALLAAVPLHAS